MRIGPDHLQSSAGEYFNRFSADKKKEQLCGFQSISNIFGTSILP